MLSIILISIYTVPLQFFKPIQSIAWTFATNKGLLVASYTINHLLKQVRCGLSPVVFHITLAGIPLYCLGGDVHLV